MEGEMLQRLLTRMDFLEHRLLQDARNEVVDVRDELHEVRSTVASIQRARRAHEDEAEIIPLAAAPVRAPIASHRGPGFEAAASGSATTSVVLGTRRDSPPHARRTYTNSLVRSRQSTPPQRQPSEYDIASPANGAQGEIQHDTVTAQQAEGAPLWTEQDTQANAYQSPQARVVDLSIALGSLMGSPVQAPPEPAAPPGLPQWAAVL